MDLAEKRVLILGLGDSGLAMARWCASQGARVLAWDSREAAPGDGAFAELFGEHLRLKGEASALIDRLEATDLIAISPGLSPLQQPVKAVLDAAAARHLAVWGEFEFFAKELLRLAQDGYRPHVLAVTGTNGKTTVTSLTGQLCRRAGRTVAVAGNIGPSVLVALMQAQKANSWPEVWVLELSSFQLHSTDSFAPDAAVILNLTQDHLDWHGSMAAYRDAKLRIFAHARTRIVNRDDQSVVDAEKALAAAATTQRVSFGLGEPRALEDFGVCEQAGMRWLSIAEAADETPVATRRQKAFVEPERRLTRLMPAEALRVRGDHNIGNALAALALGRAIGLPMAPMLRALADYRGEAHRVETVAQFHGVDFIDDSKGTNVGATVAALNGLGQRVILIAGGDGKGQDFAPLASPIARHARAVMLIGRDRALLRAAIASAAAAAHVPVEDCATLEEAVQRAAALAQPGDAVLLSPACASLDMFRNYAHRADVFRDAVHELMMEAGQPC